MPDGRLIKRYANRKLYDTANSRYVTLEEVAALLEAGEDVRIVDNRSKADITAVTLAQIRLEEEKRDRKAGPVPALRQILQRHITEPVQQIRTSVEESVSRLLKSDPARTEVRPTDADALARLLKQVNELGARLERIEAHLGLTPPDR